MGFVDKLLMAYESASPEEPSRCPPRSPPPARRSPELGNEAAQDEAMT